MSGPALAAIVVAYGSEPELPTTLASLREQLAPDDELVVVDNASPDASAELARSAGATVVELEHNAGFAGGCRAGAEASRAELLFFLNPDARLQPGCVDALRAAARERPAWGAWQALVLLAGGAGVNSAGGVTHFTGLGWADAASPPSEPAEVSFASGAALVIRRTAWDEVDGFDAAYFMYGEDVDLSLRLRLSGWGVGIVPAARVEHAYEFAKGAYKWFYLERNRWWTVLGAYPGALLWRVLPAMLALELALLPVAALGGWLPAKLRAQAAVLRSVVWALRRRRRVMATRRAPAAAFASGLSSGLDSAYLGRAAAIRPVVAAQAAYWRVVERGLRR